MHCIVLQVAIVYFEYINKMKLDGKVAPEKNFIRGYCQEGIN